MSRWIRGIKRVTRPQPTPRTSLLDEKASTSDASERDGENADEQSAPPTGITLALIIFALCMSILVMSLGMQLLSSAPKPKHN